MLQRRVTSDDTRHTKTKDSEHGEEKSVKQNKRHYEYPGAYEDQCRYSKREVWIGEHYRRAISIETWGF